jgi:hypothetical protein
MMSYSSSRTNDDIDTVDARSRLILLPCDLDPAGELPTALGATIPARDQEIISHTTISSSASHAHTPQSTPQQIFFPVMADPAQSSGQTSKGNRIVDSVRNNAQDVM